MNASPDTNGKPWTVRRWIHLVSVTMVIQVAILVAVGRRPTPPVSRPGFATKIRLISEPAPASLMDLMTVSDPALFALPSLHGFSGATWLRYPLLQHNPVERVEVPKWLDLDFKTLGHEFVDFVSTNQVPAGLMIDLPVPSIAPYEKISIISDAVAPLSRFYVEGALAGRTLLNPPRLPSWPHTEILSNTTVRALVDAAGWNCSATLVSRSGLPAADEYATRLVESARFRPLPAGDGATDEFTWGTFVFLWHTRPVAATNVPTALP